MSLILPLLLAAAPAPTATAHWTSYGGEQRCSLIRTTGGPASKALVIRSVPGTERAEILWFDPEWRIPIPLSHIPVEVVLQPSDTVLEAETHGVSSRGQAGFAIDNLGGAFLRKLAESNAIRIKISSRKAIDIPLEGAAGAVASLRSCEADMLRSWGLDAAAIQSQREPVKTVESTASWFDSSDYPTKAIGARASGSVLARLKVWTDGRVNECWIVESSGNAALDAATCRILQTRGRFGPALDANGKPTVGFTALRVHWWTQ